MAHSFFFQSGSVYLLLFDCSKQDIIGENKLLYWFHFLQTQIGSTSPVILIATKVDQLSKQSYLLSKFKERINNINTTLKDTIKNNGINLNIHIFKGYEGDGLYFHYIDNRQRDLNKSGINILYSLLSNKYDNVEHSVSTTLKHKIVFEKIEELSGRFVKIPSQNERIKKSISLKQFLGSLQTKFSTNNFDVNENQDSKKDEIPFISVSDLLITLNEKNDLNEIFERKEIEKVLEDLHKLGLIIYFKKKSLNDTIISSPQWFNKLFKSILDFGRKNVEFLFESIYNKLKETKNRRMRDVFENLVLWLKGNSKLEEIKDIWKDKEELKKSNLDKISFENLLIKLEELIEKLVEQKEFSIFEIEMLKDCSSSSISQKLIFIDENKLNLEMTEKLLENYRFKGDIVFREKKEFLLNLLTQFDLVIPTKRLEYRMEGKIIRNMRTYLIPLLFPPYNPNSSYNRKKENQKNECVLKDDFLNEWIVDYFLPFKPSAVWKLLFMRIRQNCVGMNISKREMVKEVYWLNGFSFYLVESDRTKTKTNLELEFIENQKNSKHFLMRIVIKSNLFDINLFYYLIHQTIQTFAKDWIVPDISNKIDIKITKKTVDILVENIGYSMEITENNNLSRNKFETKENKEKFKCVYCGLSISLFDIVNECDKCKII